MCDHILSLPKAQLTIDQAAVERLGCKVGPKHFLHGFGRVKTSNIVWGLTR